MGLDYAEGRWMFARGQEERKQKDAGVITNTCSQWLQRKKSLLRVYNLICTVQVVLHLSSSQGKKIRKDQTSLLETFTHVHSSSCELYYCSKVWHGTIFLMVYKSCMVTKVSFIWLKILYYYCKILLCFN